MKKIKYHPKYSEFAQVENFVNYFPNDKILDLSKFKAFADENINMAL